MKTPKTVSFSGKLLEEMKQNNQVASEVLGELRKKADEIAALPTLTVVNRKMHALSGNIHDYASIGTYWWPNPDTPDGLPYIRQDGITNPLAEDSISHENMCKNVITLALAAYYFEDAKYSNAAKKAIYDWYLNPKTYMTPHAEYSQSIPGICNGRGIGIIDFRFSYHVFDAVAILESINCIDKSTVNQLKDWYSKFADWLLTSENGLTADTELNNHGTWYDAHIMAISVFTEREALFKKVSTTSYARRFVAQVELDGRQPLELSRTMGMVYSLANLQALTVLANIAALNGYDEFIKEDKRYGSNIIKKAIDYIYPYAVAPETFPYQEIAFSNVPEYIAPLLLWLDARYPNENYADKALPFIKKAYTWLAKPFI